MTSFLHFSYFLNMQDHETSLKPSLHRGVEVAWVYVVIPTPALVFRSTARAWIYPPLILTYSLQGADASFGPFAVPVRRTGQSQGTKTAL
jgi:hypothetical protein